MGCASSKAPSNVEAEQAAAKPTGAVEGGSGAAVYGGDVKSDAPKAGVVVKSFSDADKKMAFGDKVSIDMVMLGSAKCMRATMQPGTQWREDVLPAAAKGNPALVGKSWCPARHVGMIESGTFEVTMEDGKVEVITGGMAFVIEPGHDFKVLGDAPVVYLEVESKLTEGLAAGGGTTYATGMEEAEAASLVAKAFEGGADKTMVFPPNAEEPLGTACVCMLGPNAKGMKASLKPGWTWQECVKPMLPEAMKDRTTCPARHVGFVKSGTFHMKHSDGSEFDVKAGECYVCEPDHDAWVVGDEHVEFFEFESTLK